MSHPRIITFCLLLALATALPLQAQDTLAGPNWARRDALQAAAAVDALAELKPLFEHARAGRDDALLQALQRIAGAEQWPPPARERILHAFALGLGDLPAEYSLVNDKIVEDWPLSGTAELLQQVGMALPG